MNKTVMKAKKLLAPYPDWIEELIFLSSAFYLSKTQLAKRLHKSRNAVYDAMERPEVMADILERRRKFEEQRVAELVKIDNIAIARVEEAIKHGDTKAALTHLAGRGIYSNKTEVSGDLKVEIVSALVDKKVD